MSCSSGILRWRASFRYRLIACVAVGLVCEAALAPAAIAFTAPLAGTDRTPPAHSAAPLSGTGPQGAAAAPVAALTPSASRESTTSARDVVPQLWTPRAVATVDTSAQLDAATLFDGDPATGLAVDKGGSAVVRLDLGSAREVIGLGIHGEGRATFAIYTEDGSGARSPIRTVQAGALNLTSEHWAQVAAAAPTRASTLVVQWTASSTTPVDVTDLALWVAGRSRSALAEAAMADRLVTELPENAAASTAVPWTASVARVTAQGSVSASFAVTLNREPRLGRAFLTYELDTKAHWTGVARSINGHVVRGGYRAEAKGLGGVQVEEINPGWLKRGDNQILFQPTLIEDGIGYSIRNVRVVSVPLGVDGAPAPAARSALSDGDLSTGVGGPGAHTASVSVPSDREPAFLSFYLDKPTTGTLTVTAERAAAGRARRKGQVQVDLKGRPAGWQTVPVAGVLPATSELRLRVAGDRESKAQVSEARLQSFPALSSPADLTVAYPLHGECHDHKTYVRGFVAGPDRLPRPQLLIDGQPAVGQIDADGSFEVDVPEPTAARGKPWSIRLDVTTEGAAPRTRTVPVDTCLEPPKGRIIGVSPPVEDVGAPYGAVVAPGRASTLSFAGARIEIPAGAVEDQVRVTMRPLDRGQLAPLTAEMENVSTGGGALRFGPHGLQFKKPIKVTLPIDSARMPPGMTAGDVVGFFFDEASSKWTELPKVSGRSDLVVAQSTHFTDFIAATVRTPDHPDMQQFNPNSMKGMKVGEPGAGITMIQPPEANADGSVRLSYPIETPPARADIGPKLALTYDSERVNTSGWLGVGWDLRLSSIEVDSRFGVPKYDPTDTYLIDGAPLVSTPTAGKYIRRVESSFDLIERMGTLPTNYWWKVTDKNGTVFTYGSVTNSRLSNPRTNQTANIFRWYLEKVQDTYGNLMTITYVHDAFSTPTPNVEQFDEVYPSVIDYTAGPSLAANYHVEFRLDPTARPDVAITGRPGFLVSSRKRLTDILVKNGAAVVRQYHFSYGTNLADTLQKSVLSSVALWSTLDTTSSELYRHSFEYNKAPATGSMFTTQQTWGQMMKAATPPATGTVVRPEKGLSHSADHLGGREVTLGFGFPVFSATGSYGRNSGSSTPDLALFPVTGKGMPDQLDTAGILSLNAVRGVPATEHFVGSSVTGLTALGSNSRSGWSAGGNLSGVVGLFGAGARYSRQVSTDNGIISDINGDGFPDVVYNTGGALTAYINSGNRSFTQQQWTNFSLTDSPFSTASRLTDAAAGQAYFKTDPLVRWVAPFGGTVSVTVTGALESSSGAPTRVDVYVVNDAVRSLTLTDTTTRTIASVTNKTVAAGDRIYVRAAAVNDSGGNVEVASSIVYTAPTGRSTTELDPTGNPIFVFDEDQDQRMAGMPRVPWPLTARGDIAVSRCFRKAATPDEVTASLVIRDKTGAVFTHWDKVLPAAATTEMCFDNAVLAPSPSDNRRADISGVFADHSVNFEFTSHTPVDPDDVSTILPANNYEMVYTWYCRVTANGGQACGAPVSAGGGGYTFTGDPYPNFPINGPDISRGGLGNDDKHPVNSYQIHVLRTFNNNQTTTPQPIRSQAAPSASVTFGGSVTTTAALTEDVVVLIQGVNKLHAKVRIPSGTASGAVFPLTTGAIALTSGEPVFFTIHSPTIIGGNVSWAPTMNGTAVQTANINRTIWDPTFDNNRGPSRDPMSGGFHRWFYGDWNDSVAFSDSAIVRTSAIPSSTDAVMGMVPVDTDDQDEFNGRGGARFIHESSFTIMDPGRMNDSISNAGSASGISALRVSDTWNVDVSATASGVTAGGNGGDATTQVDFFDVNGDRFPDSVTTSGVQFNNGTGAFAGRQTINAGFGHLRRTLNASLQAGVAVSGSTRQLISESDGQGKTKRLTSTASLSGTIDYGVSSTRIDFADVNGDGLQDHILQEQTNSTDVTPMMVKLNLGYGFATAIPWTAAAGWSTSATSVGITGITATDVGRVLNLIPNVPNNTNVVRLQDNGSFSASLGLSVGNIIGGGGGPSWSVTRKWVDLIDVNGDGLLDHVLKVPGTATLRVRLNKGDRFDAEQTWTLPDWTTSTGSNFTFLSPDGLGFSTMDGWSKNLNFQICFFLCFGASGFSSDSKGGPTADFEDIDGDGKVDQVMKVPGDPHVYAKLNNIGKTNLLSVVNRPMGSRFSIEYARSGNHVDLAATPNKISMPGNQWVMSKVDLDSGTGQTWNATTTQTFDYNNPAGTPSGYYDPLERENLGFANVKTIFPTEDVGGTSIAVDYHNQNYYLRNLEKQKTWTQNNAQAVRLRAVVNSYSDPVRDLLQQPPRTGAYFPAPINTVTQHFETTANANLHTVARTFDANGNLTDVVDFGDTNSAGFNDDFNYHIDYTLPAGTAMMLPSAITVRTGPNAGSGTLLAKRVVTSFNAQGKPNGVTDVIAGGKSPDANGTARTEAAPASATWTFTYDAFGNVQQATSPNGPSADPDGTARTLQYTYDTTTQTYRVTTAQSDSDTTLRYSGTATYDLRFGLPTRIIDITGAKQEIDYDNYGRVTKAFAPSDFDSSGNRLDTNAPTIAVSYSEVAHTAGAAETLPAWSMASHRSNAPAEGTLPTAALTTFRNIRTVNFVDGLKRNLQVKKDITRDDGTGATTAGMSVTGKTVFDARGRVYQQGQPVFAGGTSTPTTFVTVAMTNATQFAYDVLDRMRQEQHPDNGSQATTTISYQKGVSPKDGRTWVVKLTSDPLYSQNTNYHYRAEYSTGRGDLKVVAESNLIANALQNLYTYYDYDQLGRVVAIEDAKHFVTTAEYDTVGNLVAVTSPDAGRREWRYCVAGYVCAEQSAAMRAAGANVRIQYSYDRNRPTGITYPNPTANPGVSYVYGTATDTGAANGFTANRIKRRTDEAGQVDYTYDALGNFASETALLKNQMVAGTNYQSYATQYKWDNFGRLIDVTIPGTTNLSTPSETIRYGYDAGGAVTSALGRAGTTNFTYVTHVGYNEFGERNRIAYGNQASGTYDYTLDTRRLQAAKTFVGSPATQAQAITYTYDALGNVKTRIQNLGYDTVATHVVPIGGASTFNYSYDPLNQLTHADMVVQVKQSERYRASDDLSYDALGNITTKNQTSWRDTFNASGGLTGTFAEPGMYIFNPNYAGTAFNTSPHAASSLSQTFPTTATTDLAYDRDGNLISSLVAGAGRFITWTDTNRVRSVAEGTSANHPTISQVLYSADGTRTHNKVTTAGTTTETLYVNQYLTVRNGTLPTKHVYLSNARVASKVESNATVNNIYWYHSDNIQSAQYVTTTAQDVVEHLEYFPTGEIWREEKDTSKLRIELAHATTFTGKELDPSGYYYFGSRYYDPRAQVWLSPDPMLKRYVEGKTAATVFNPRNLGLYTYAWNNPVVLKDSSGGCVEDLCVVEASVGVAAFLYMAGAIYFSQPAVQRDISRASGEAWRQVKAKGEAIWASTISKNKEQGKAWEEKVVEKVKETDTHVAEQVTIETAGGTKIRPDVVSRDPATGTTKVTEAKSSDTAPLTPNQTKGFPELATGGGTVVGKGKPGFPGGTKIPPTKVDIKRP